MGRGVVVLLGIEYLSVHFVGLNSPARSTAYLLDTASCGMNHALMKTKSGEVYVIGSNLCGQCGLSSVHKEVLAITKLAENVKLVSAGSSFSFILFQDGRLTACGVNKYGQLGICASDSVYGLTLVPGTPTNIQEISGGYSHTCILANGVVYGSGFNSHGQLSFLDSAASGSGFVQAKFPRQVKSVACGVWNTAFLTIEGDLYICGKAPMYQEGPESVSYFIKEYQDSDNRARNALTIGTMRKIETDNMPVIQIKLGSSTGIALGQDTRTIFIIDLVRLALKDQIKHTTDIRQIAIGGNSWGFV